jgi:hypothetical protein
VTRAETIHISIGALVGAILMLAALLLYGLGIISIPFVSAPAGSPYVRGGSIRGSANNPSWAACTPGVCDSGYLTKVTDNTTLVFSSIGHLTTLSGLQGWTVNFYDRDSQGSVNGDPAVQLCSEMTCSAKSLDAGKSVYLRTPRPRDTLIPHGQGQLRFHNHYNSNCDSDDITEGYCDHVVLVGIVLNNGSTILPEARYACEGFPAGRCKVGFP